MIGGANTPNANVPADHFALLATTEFEMEAGDYSLEVSSDDGVRVYLDDRPVVEAWTCAHDDGRKDRPDARVWPPQPAR